MDEALKELGITPEGEMGEDEKPGEVVDDSVAKGDVGDHEDKAVDSADLSLEEEEALEKKESEAEDKEEDE